MPQAFRRLGAAKLMSRPTELLPLDRFDHPNLHKRPANVLGEGAAWWLNIVIAKECAGLRHDLRSSGARMRQAFIAGDFERNERVALEWTVSGMRDFLLPSWHCVGALTMYELARGLRVLGPSAGGHAAFLNQWGERPDRPLPKPQGTVLAFTDLRLIPCEAIAMAPDDPRREDIPGEGTSCLDLDGLRYVLPTSDLERLQAEAGSKSEPVPRHRRDPQSMVPALGRKARRSCRTLLDRGHLG